MYENSRIPSYSNVSSHPYRVQYSHWPPDTPTTGIAISPALSQTTGTLSSTSYISQPHRTKQVSTPNYVNYMPPSPPLPPPPSLPPTPSHSKKFYHPKSTIYWNSTSKTQPIFNGNNLRQRSESKAIIGIVKPMVHQRSYTQLNNTDNENKTPQITMGSYEQNFKYSLHSSPSPIMSRTPSETSSIIYRSRPISSYNNINNHPPLVPRRHSSINTNKYLSSRRSSRTTSTTSSIVGFNELLTMPSSYGDELSLQQPQEQTENDDKTMIDIKRLEMFYGSVGTIVKSARSIARLYTTTTRQLVNFENWSCQQRGVPAWIYNTGANLKRARQLRLLLAQHESCFSIWSSLISDRAELHLPKDNYITCWLPESNILVVLLFECNDACRLFFRHYYEILEYEKRMDSENQSLISSENMTQSTKTNSNNKEIPRRYSRLRTISNKHDKEQQQQQQQQQESDMRRCRSLSRIRTVKKSAISGPINFEHVNHISSGCNRERPLSSTVTLRSLHASMSHLPTNGTLIDRYSKQTKNRASALFEPRTTAV